MRTPRLCRAWGVCDGEHAQSCFVGYRYGAIGAVYAMVGCSTAGGDGEKAQALSGMAHAVFYAAERSWSRWPYLGFAGLPATTAGTPSGLMLKAKNVKGSSPGFPHWCTRPNGS